MARLRIHLNQPFEVKNFLYGSVVIETELPDEVVATFGEMTEATEFEFGYSHHPVGVTFEPRRD